MPRLPDASDLGRNVPQSRQGVVQGPRPDPTLNALDQLGQTLDREFERMDVLRAEDAANQLRKRQFDLQMGEQGYEKRKGSAALDKGTLDGYRSQFKSARDELDQGLSTPRQKAMFKRFADAADLQFTSDLGRHVARESEAYAKDLTASVLQNETDIATRAWNNPDQIAVSLERIDGRLAAQQELDNAPPDQVALLRRQARSKLHLNVIQAAVDQQNLDYAEKYLTTMKDDIEASDMLRISGLLGTQRREIEAQNYARTVANPPAQSELGKAFSAIIGVESGGQQFGKDGKPLTSNKGAIGIAQVMPKTAPEAARLAGLPWDEKRYKEDAEYNKALGLAYFQQQVKEFGNLPQAAAAYNAGPQATKDAIAKVQKEGGDWLSYLPAETQAYVPKVVQDYAKGGAKQPTWTDIDAQLVERFGNNPDQLKTARAEAKITFDQRKEALKVQQDEAFTAGMQAIENGATYDQIPMALRMKMDADKLSTLREYDAKVRRGQPVETDWNLYYNLKTEAGKNPGKFAQRNLTVDFPHLADSERKSLIDLQVKAKEGGDMSAFRTVDQAREQFVRQIYPKDKQAKSPEANALRVRFDEALLAEQQATGKPADIFTADKISKRMLTDYVTSPGRIWDTVKPAYEIAYKDIPAADVAAITKVLRENGITPSEGAILNEYIGGLEVNQ